jgi:hypothetical protein
MRIIPRKYYSVSKCINLTILVDCDDNNKTSEINPNLITYRLTNFRHVRKTLYLSVFRKSAEKIQVSLKSDKNNGHFS